MKLTNYFTFTQILLAIFLITTVKGDISDDECRIWEEETTTIATAVDKPVNQSVTMRKNPNLEKKKRKKSLILVFDATGSMSDDLAQLRGAAKEIVKAFSEQEENPIGNYILSVFRDPDVEPLLKTTDPAKLLERLDKITITGGGDCPELALTGIKQAIEVALPNSNAFVFSDASAKDFDLFYNVKENLQKKQIALSFLLTGVCFDGKNAEGYKVFEKLSKSSGGLVYDMSRDSIASFMEKLRKTLDLKFETLKTFDYDKAGKNKETVKVDDTFSKLNVIVSGKNSQLTVKDKNNKEVVGSDRFSLDNIKFVTIDVTDSTYTIEASADSAYSVRVGGISELKFEFGFSTNLPSDQAETSVRPLIGHKNVLSIFVSDPKLVKCLTQATIIPASSDDSFPEISVFFDLKQGNFYSSKPIDIPIKMFKIRIFGYDRTGNVIERLISTGIDSVKGVPPEIEIEFSALEVNQYGNLHLNCKVMSLTPTTTTWMFDSKILNAKNSNQSTHNILIVENFDQSNVGNYVCKAENTLGTDSKEISIKMRIAPTVRVEPDSLTVKNGENGTLTCIVEGNYGNYQIRWRDGFDDTFVKNQPTYSFKANPRHNKQSIVCEVTNGDFEVYNQSLITVQYAPEFYFRTNGSTVKKDVEHGNSVLLSCNSHENEKGTAKWFYSANGKSFKTQLNVTSKLYNISQVLETEAGHYKCVIENSLGSATKYFHVKEVAKEPPKILSPKTVNYSVGKALILECFCANCLPVTSKWTYNDKKPIHKIREIVDDKNDKFKSILTIDNASEIDEKTYECELTNDKSMRKMEIQAVMQSQPMNVQIKVNDNPVENTFEIVKHEDYALICSANAKPTPEFTWYKNGVEIGDNPVILAKENIEDNSGFYECKVENSFGAVTKSLEVLVTLSPKLDGKKENSIQVGTNVKTKLVCEISGNPKPEFVWMFNDKPVLESETRKFLNEKQILEIEGIEENEGTYKCFGRNDFGEESMKFEVEVKELPIILNSKDEHVMIKTGKRLNLPCFGGGFPKPEIYWMKDGSEDVVGDGNFFMIPKVKTEDSGIYWCYAENSNGKSRKKFTIDVRL